MIDLSAAATHALKIKTCNLMYNGQSPVKHRSTFVHLSVHPSIHSFVHPPPLFSPLSPLRLISAVPGLKLAFPGLILLLICCCTCKSTWPSADKEPDYAE